MSLQVVNIELLGASFSIQTDESAEYIEGLVARLRQRLDGLRSSTRVQDPLKLSILANITILDELSRERERPIQARAAQETIAGLRAERSGEEEEFSRVAARLIADLDRSLEPPRP